MGLRIAVDLAKRVRGQQLVHMGLQPMQRRRPQVAGQKRHALPDHLAAQITARLQRLLADCRIDVRISAHRGRHFRLIVDGISG
jgi:hypothetical protein